ncbi:hypothetical protein [Oceanobacillus sp. CAU 1775]
MKGLFMRAAESQEKLVIFYMDGAEQVTQRYIKVLKIRGDYMLAYCFYRKKVRTFKMSNILSAAPVKKGVGA